MQTSTATRTKGEVVRDFRTGAILDAARRVIAEQGYADASVERIAQAAGVAKGTLYLYFDSKQALLIQLLADNHAAGMEQARRAIGPVRGDRARLRAALRSLLATTVEGRGLYQALMAHPELGVEGHTPVSEQLRVQVDDTRAFLGALIEAGVDGGELRTPDPARAARYLLALLTSAVLRAVLEDPDADLDVELENLTAFIFDGLAARPAEATR